MRLQYPPFQTGVHHCIRSCGSHIWLYIDSDSSWNRNHICMTWAWDWPGTWNPIMHKFCNKTTVPGWNVDNIVLAHHVRHMALQRVVIPLEAEKSHWNIWHDFGQAHEQEWKKQIHHAQKHVPKISNSIKIYYNVMWDWRTHPSNTYNIVVQVYLKWILLKPKSHWNMMILTSFYMTFFMFMCPKH